MEELESLIEEEYMCNREDKKYKYFKLIREYQIKLEKYTWI